MEEVLLKLSDATCGAIVALAELPKQIRGFGPVKEANEAKAAIERCREADQSGDVPAARAAASSET